jgi:hypothetical protein
MVGRLSWCPGHRFRRYVTACFPRHRADVAEAPYIPYPAATMFAWTAFAVASVAAPEVKTPS